MRDHATFRIGLAMVAGAILAGCAENGGPASTAAAPSSATPSPSAVSPSAVPPSAVPPSAGPSPARSTDPTALPTITKTAKPPREPTDNLPTTGWVAGMVTRGGTGPCYGLIADDGTRYALYSTGGTELTKGERVKVKLEPSMLRIYCGPGALMTMLEVERIK
ncbi:hypothetical protein [Actinoplanes aureus]|uniref:Lipoprotein n=1 Tax=Actinoplanes aureus TaxID=2792083 RepID=A0A931C876_9ACTN|nr:hypothetical protein [Actinoplanes aureus]MBG0565254.1 hypothetical protein [Actinoplanes aureus]